MMIYSIRLEGLFSDKIVLPPSTLRAYMVMPREDVQNSLPAVLLHVNAIFLSGNLSEIQILIHVTKSTLHFVVSNVKELNPSKTQ